MLQPPAKKPRVDGKGSSGKKGDAPVAEPVEAVELEKDAAHSNQSAKLTTSVCFHASDTTINVMVNASGTLLRPLSEGCFQHLLAGARASVGVKSGRYMFEVKAVECVCPSDDHGKKGAAPKQTLRIGFSTSTSGLFLDDAESVCFDSNGLFVQDQQRSEVGQKFVRDSVVGMLLNLDDASPNASTVSLFVDGRRASAPQRLPECLKGKPLFPTVVFQNFMVHVNFGPEPLAPLPFTCRLVGGADQAHAEVAPAPDTSRKHEVLFPIGLPDEGAFEWLDCFLTNNRQYTELSERSIMTWGEKSGLRRPLTGFGKNGSRDQPDMHFGIPVFDDRSFVQLVESITRVQIRDYVVMHMRRNLLKDERSEALVRFPKRLYKRVAFVVIGEPSSDVVEYSHSIMLKRKEEAFKAQLVEEQRKKEAVKRQTEMEKMRRKADAMRKKLIEDKKRKFDHGKAAKGGSKNGSTEEAKQEEAIDEEEKDEEEEEEEAEQELPKIELTEEEKLQKIPTSEVSDLTVANLSKHFSSFSLPERGEDFDDIRYAWGQEAECAEYLKAWILDRKHSVRVEDVVPSPWFNEKWATWQKTLMEWTNKLNLYKAVKAQKKAERVAEANRKAVAAKAAAKAAAWKKGGAIEQAEPEPEEDSDVDFEGVDTFGLEDICDVDSGAPLFAQFLPEDWVLTNLRFELYIMIHAFQRDCGDPERTGVHLDHLAFYYQKYFKKPLLPKVYNVDTIDAVVALVEDAVNVNFSRILETLIPDELENFDVFVKIAEESRRARILTVETGDESARVKIQPHVLAPYQPKAVPKTASAPKAAYSPKAAVAPKAAAAPKAGAVAPKVGAVAPKASAVAPKAHAVAPKVAPAQPKSQAALGQPTPKMQPKSAPQSWGSGNNGGSAGGKPWSQNQGQATGNSGKAWGGQNAAQVANQTPKAWNQSGQTNAKATSWNNQAKAGNTWNQGGGNQAKGGNAWNQGGGNQNWKQNAGSFKDQSWGNKWKK
eukprot:TRINITY_DN1288_c0_g1_i1.p1 TRINITY_DN1288_c0_g1~~TRINITY_DN1288_c0_g1_i1.p1  ORF type:complete len:993 (+),score=204.02 TRINITY_DN1288_c0_g1_i1:55-3033(+)